ncbi:MAG: hypothetical protein HY606_11305 [Planctomycetes bacterium]|nr:hypothetical protein [Planctomycetota bacterium]
MNCKKIWILLTSILILLADAGLSSSAQENSHFCSSCKVVVSIVGGETTIEFMCSPTICFHFFMTPWCSDLNVIDDFSYIRWKLMLPSS